MEAMKLQKQVPVSAMLDLKIVIPAIGRRSTKLDPRLIIKNPVMFVVEVVAALTTVIFLRDLVTSGENLASPSRSSCGCGSRCCSPILPRRWRKAAARRRPIAAENPQESQAKC